nr:hypothetical protein BaRGS_032979 [Batillaria attramentaria]
MVETLETGDYCAIAAYFLLVLAVGIWVGTSIFASNVGAHTFIGMAGTGAATGFGVAIYSWHAIFILIALGWVFLPVYVSSGTFTMPEYVKKRYGGRRLRIYLSVLALILYAFTKVSAEIYAGSVVMQVLMGWNTYLSVALILTVTAFYTVIGGLAAVLYTDALQAVILVTGAFILMGLSLVEVGGWSGMVDKYPMAAANYTLANPENYSCGMPRDDYMHIWRDPVTGDIPWTGAVFGLTTLGIWSWCNDQWQLVLFSDESRFLVRPRDGRIRVGRCPGEQLADDAVQEVTAFGGGSVMVMKPYPTNTNVHQTVQGDVSVNQDMTV